MQYLMVLSAKKVSCFIRPVKTLVKDDTQFSGFGNSKAVRRDRETQAGERNSGWRVQELHLF